MSTLERSNDDATTMRPAGIDGHPGFEGLERIRTESRSLAAVGREAVRRALAEDTTKFLRATPQSGGE